MTKQQLIQYIQREVAELARIQHTDPQAAYTYMTGFLIAQLAEAVIQDSHTLDRLRTAITNTKQRIEHNGPAA